MGAVSRGDSSRPRGDANVGAKLLMLVVGAAAVSGGLFLNEQEKVPRFSKAGSKDVGAPFVLDIGPEGCPARPDGEALRALGAISLSLGPLILRTETAVLAALAVLRHEEG